MLLNLGSLANLQQIQVTRAGPSTKVNQEHCDAEFAGIVVSQSNELKNLKRKLMFLREQLKLKRVSPETL